MTNTLPDLGKSFAKMRLQDKLSQPKGMMEGNFFYIVAMAAMNNQVKEAAKMVKEQYDLGHQEEMEWAFGASTIELINQVYA